MSNASRASASKYNSWNWTQGGNFIAFNFQRGKLQDKRLRTAAAHAIDRNAIHQAVYYGNSAMSDQPYPPGNAWHLEGIRSLEYDPDRAKAILKEARATGTEVKIVVNTNIVVHRESAQVIQDLDYGRVQATVEPLDVVPFRDARNGTFDALINGHTYRFDPDDFFPQSALQERLLGSLSRWKNEKYDRLVEEAKRITDPGPAQGLYTEAWNIVNVELPFYYMHEIPQTSAAVKEPQGYQPGSSGACPTGRRSAYRLYGQVVPVPFPLMKEASGGRNGVFG